MPDAAEGWRSLNGRVAQARSLRCGTQPSSVACRGFGPNPGHLPHCYLFGFQQNSGHWWALVGISRPGEDQLGGGVSPLSQQRERQVPRSASTALQRAEPASGLAHPAGEDPAST